MLLNIVCLYALFISNGEIDLQFFKYECNNPYEVMARVDYEMLHLEDEMRSIQESGSLFEVNVPEFKLLKQCRKELRMLKVFIFFYFITRSIHYTGYCCKKDCEQSNHRRYNIHNKG